MSLYDGVTLGSFIREDGLYKFKVKENGETIIKKVDELLAEDECYNCSVQSNTNKDFFAKESNKDITKVLSVSNTNEIIEYTVIVPYTQAFADELDNDSKVIKAYMNLLEIETNEGYKNSNVNLRMRIVHYYKTTYVENDDSRAELYGDMDNIIKGGPYVDELERLRDQYHADIMVLLVGNLPLLNKLAGVGHNGLAMEIKCVDHSAFAIVREESGTGSFTFAHEIGHLFGARHAFSHDDNLTPYSYGHGYCSESIFSWKTIMASVCPTTAGVEYRSRKPYWSNPNIQINDEATGTHELEFNTKVLNDRAREVAAFRTEPTEDLNSGDLASYITGKTFYGVKGNCGVDNDLVEVKFNASITSMNLTYLTGPDIGKSREVPVQIIGDKLIFEGDSYMMIASETSEYILFNDFEADGSPAGQERFYYDKHPAEDYLDSIRGSGECSENPTGTLPVNTMNILWNNQTLTSTNIITKSILIKEDSGNGFAHIPEVQATLNNGYTIGFKYCALNNTTATSLCNSDDWGIMLVDEQHEVLYSSGGSFSTSDDPYNGKITGSFAGGNEISGNFNFDNMIVTIQ